MKELRNLDAIDNEIDVELILKCEVILEDFLTQGKLGLFYRKNPQVVVLIVHRLRLNVHSGKYIVYA